MAFLLMFGTLMFNVCFNEIQGTIPSWLQGELVRVGPGIQKIGNDQYSHLFDGLAILHKFTVKDGKVTAANYLSSNVH